MTDHESLFSKTFGHIYEYLDPAEILLCREVSFEWKLGVDSWLQSDPLHIYKCKLLMSPTLHKMKKWARSRYKFKSVQEIQTFLSLHDIYRRQGENPFVTKHVVFTDQNLAEDPQYFWREATQLVQQFGVHVKFFELFINRLDSMKLYELILQTLPSLVELRRFEIFFKDPSDKRGKAYGSWRKKKNTLEAMTPLPELHSLVQLAVTNVPTNILSQLFQACGQGSHVKILLVCSTSSKMWAYFDYSFLQNQFLDLETLNVVAYGMSNLESFMETPDLLPFLQDLRVNVRLSSADLPNHINFESLCVKLNSLRSQLRLLELRLFGDASKYGGATGKIARLNLPKLEGLQIFAKDTTPITCLDFMEGLHALKKLKITQFCWPFEEIGVVEADNSLIQFAGYESRMEESNIWTKLPQLEQITFGDTSKEPWHYWSASRPSK